MTFDMYSFSTVQYILKMKGAFDYARRQKNQIAMNDLGFIEYQALSPSYDLARPPPPPSSRHQVVSLSESSCVSPVDLVGEEPNHTTTREPGPL